MSQVYTVPKDKVCEVWEEASSLLNIAFLNDDNLDYGLEYIKQEFFSGRQHQFLVVNNKEIVGAYTVELIDYTNHRVALTTCMGGKKVFSKNTVQQYEDWARLQGVTKIRAYAKEAQARLFRLKLGLQPVTSVVEKNL